MYSLMCLIITSSYYNFPGKILVGHDVFKRFFTYVVIYVLLNLLSAKIIYDKAHTNNISSPYLIAKCLLSDNISNRAYVCL